MSIDYTGSQGGLLSMAFAAGCVACFGAMSALGAFIKKMMDRSRAVEIASKDDEINQLRRLIEEDRTRCAAMEVRLVQRIQQLEGAVMRMSPINTGAIHEH